MTEAVSLHPLEAQAYRALEIAGTDAPFAVAFSGGGDSTALLYALRNHPNKSHAFIVDHALREGSVLEAQRAYAFAKQLGYEAEILTWTDHAPGQGPRSGVQLKARNSRYALMGEALRSYNIGTLLTGHTLDDQAETLLMRYDRSTDWRGAAGVSPSRYAPLWPQLAQVTVLRPLLSLSRDALRAYNRENDLHWSEDPSNQNVHYSRIRARQKLQKKPFLKQLLLEPVADLRAGRNYETQRLAEWSAQNLRCHPEGYFTLDRVPPIELLWRVLRVASGTGGPIDRAKLKQLRETLTSPAFRAATLAGSKIEIYKGKFCVSRDPVAVKGRRGGAPGLSPCRVMEASFIWDGRYRVDGQTSDGATTFCSVSPAHNRIAALPRPIQETLKALPPSVRGTQPVLFDPNGQAVSVGDADYKGVKIRCLVKSRFEHALGV